MQVATEYGVPAMGGFQVEARVREGGDAGAVMVAHPESETAEAFEHIAAAVAVQLARDAAVKPRANR